MNKHPSRKKPMKIEKFEEISISCKSKKFALVRKYAKKNKIAFYCAVNIPESLVPNFEKFLKENDVLTDEDLFDEI